MADSYVTDQLTERVLIEYLRYQAHITVIGYNLSVGCGNTGTFLATVLERKEGEKVKSGYILIRSINSDDCAAFV